MATSRSMLTSGPTDVRPSLNMLWHVRSLVMLGTAATAIDAATPRLASQTPTCGRFAATIEPDTDGNPDNRSDNPENEGAYRTECTQSAKDQSVLGPTGQRRYSVDDGVNTIDRSHCSLRSREWPRK